MVNQKNDLDVITIGRSSVDLYGGQVGGRLEDMTSFQKYIGGSPTNISIGASRLGLRSAVITRVGDEHFGRFITEQLTREGVNTEGIIIDKKRLSALAILGIRDKEQFPLLFYRENCADMGLTKNEIDPDFIKRSKCVVVTGTHFSSKQVSEASFQAINYAKNNNVLVGFDIDYRPNLWSLGGHGDGESRFEESKVVTSHVQKIISHCDLIVGTEEEWHIAGGTQDTLKALRICRELTQAIIVCKRGAMGCTVFPDAIINWDSGISVKVNKIEIFNVLGAGDGFMAGFLYGWLNDQPLELCANYANACGALAVSRHGCAPAYPSKIELEHYLKNGSQHFSLRQDTFLEQLHWSTNRRKSFDNLFTLAIDHRVQFKKLAEENEKQKEDIAVFKSMALEACLEAQKTEHENVGILLDEEYAESSLHAASDHDIWIGRPIEKAGVFPLELTEEPDIGSRLANWPVNHCVKVLAPLRNDDPKDIYEHQVKLLSQLAQACRLTNHELLLEIITKRNDKACSPEQILSLMQKLYEENIYPDWWKLEPIENVEFWSKANDIVQQFDPYAQGIIVLGMDAASDKLASVFDLCKNYKHVKGFAVGRSIFFETARKWFGNKITNQQAKDEMFNKFTKLIKLWKRKN